MADTVTSFYTFSPATKARSAQVNANFANYRGDLIPIDPNTAAAAHLTYDLGTTEYRWDTAYLRVLNLIGMTTTANLRIERDNTATLGAYHVEVGSTTVGQIRSTGAWFKSNYTQTAEFNSGTLTGSSGSPATITGSLLSITTYGGNLQFGFLCGTNTSFQMHSGVTTVAAPFGIVTLYLDGAKAASFPWQMQQTYETLVAYITHFAMIPPNIFQHEAFGVSAGGHTVYATFHAATTQTYLVANGVKFFVKEV